MFYSANRNSSFLQLFMCTLLIYGLPSSIECSNILALFPHFGYSHFRVFYPMLQTLAERGHNITVITHIKASFSHANYEELLLTGKDVIEVYTLDGIVAKRTPAILFTEYLILHKQGQESCELFYNSGHVQTVLERHKRQRYELIITEFFNTDCQLGVAHVMNVPVVGLSSCALMPYYYDRIGLPDYPSYVQSEFIGFPEQLNWHQRLINFAQFKLLKLLYRFHTQQYDRRVIKQNLNVDVNVDELVRRKTALILVNQHYTLSGNYPTTAQLIQMGGIHIDENNAVKAELPENIEKFLNGIPLEQGVLFISWGSMVRASSMPPERLKVILQVLKRLPYKIIWKWETDEVPIKSDKFLFVKWAPQFRLLSHPKVKIFWGHGGLLGITEAVYCGKPMIITPLYGDQFLNGVAVVNRHVGVLLYFHDIDETHLSSAFKQIMDQSYAQNAQSLSHIFRNRENSPLNTSIWWIEHLLQKHGRIAHGLLQSPAVELNWFVYHSFDSLLLCLLGIVIFAFIVGGLVKLLCSSICHKNDKRKID